MKKQFFRICSTVLIIVLLVNMLPMSIFAEEFRESLTTEIIQPDTPPEMTTQSDAQIVGEIPSKRTQYSKEFILSNGLHLAAVYPDAVHYEEDGSWEEIDNTLKLTNGRYVNTAGVWNVSFPQQLSNSKNVTIEKDGYTLSFAMAGELHSAGLEIAGTIGGEDAATIKESVMEILVDSVSEFSEETEPTVPTLEIASSETVPEEIEPQETIVETVPETTVAVMETEPLPEATVPTEVETEQMITDVIPEQLSVSKMQLSTATVQALDKATLRESYQYAEMAPEKLHSRLSYADVYQNTDVIYDMDANRVKESIVMEAHSSTLRGYKYTLNVGRMIPVLEDDGQILFYDADQKNVVMVMPTPYLVDAAEEANWNVRVQLTGSSGIYTLTYLLPTQWLADSERAWPVILDPVVEANIAATNIEDRTVAENDTSSYKWSILDTGYSETRGKIRGFLKYVQLPQITSSDVIVGAFFQMYKVSTSSVECPVEIHKVTGTWDSQEVTWSTQPSFDASVEDYAHVKNEGWYSWTITDIVRDWYATANNGLMVKLSDANETSGTSNYRQFYSSDAGEAYRPTLSIVFRNNNGLESYWDYTSNSAGRAGTGYINNYTGNLVWVRDDMGFGGNRMPVNIQHVYNLNDAIVPSDSNNANDSGGNSFGMGYGWRTNYNQLVYQWSSNSNYYVWEDSDGTDHYFLKKSTGIYKDEDGLELTLTTTGSGTQKYCITDKNGNKSYFDTYGRLTKLENNQQTKSNIQITYTTASGKLISTIKDGVGRVYNFTYSNNLLSRISYKGTGTSEITYVTFTYTSSKLTAVTDKDGEASEYTYSGNRLLTAQDIDGYKLTYTYNTVAASWQPYRVQSVAEQDTVNNADGGTLTFAYGHNQTTITDYNGNTEIHQFNDFGNTRSIQDDEGHATFADYSRNNKDDTAGKANQLRVSSKLQNTVVNYLKYSHYDASTNTNWNPLDSTVTTERSKEQMYIGWASVKMVTTTSGTVTGAANSTFTAAPNSSYTFSAYVKTGAGAVYLAISDGSTTVTSDTLSANSNWTRLQVTYVNDTATSKSITPKILTNASCTTYIDCCQLEKAPTASRFNLIENGEFRYGTTTWTNEGFQEVLAPNTATPEMGNRAMSVTGDPTAAKKIYQYALIPGVAGDSYVVSGWARGNSAPLTGDRKFGIQVTFHYTDGSYETFEESFNPDLDGEQWQYISFPVVPQKDYKQFTIKLVYNYNVNTAYFDGIQLYKEEFGNSYTYDANGNVTSVVDLQKKNTTYEYNSNGDITRILEDNVAKMTYTYDSWRNVETATTDVGIVYSFTYDTYGNNTKVSIGSGNKTISSRAEYTTDGNRLLYTWDALDKKTSYGYNENTGMLDWVQYPEDTAATRTEYEYDTMYRMAKAECTTDTGLNQQTFYDYDEKGRLLAISSATTSYIFGYGAFGQRSAATVNAWYILAMYDYTEDANRYLQQLTYGNNHFVNYTYDNKGRLLTQTYEDGDTVSYTYDNNGALATMKDSATGRTTTYYYDLTDRMMKYVEKGTDFSHSVGYEYDTKNNLTQLVEEINGTKRTTSYTYDDDNRIETVTTDGATVTYTYDTWGRLHTKVTGNGGDTPVLTEEYIYVKPTINGATVESSQIATYKVTGGSTVTTYNYTYDDNGNILSVTEGRNDVEDTCITTYVYDSANQLIRENNQAGGFTHTWQYDAGGNILNRKEYAHTTGSLDGVTPTKTVTYGYDDVWGDMLTSYDGQTITRDEIGNPLTYNGWTYTWEHGRQLAKAEKDSVEWTYTYNADGLRTSKTNDTDTWNYIYNGSQLTQLTKGTDTLNFTYDASGTPLTVKYNGTTYYYATNIQGDVVAILGSNGTPVVSYSYDAWGNPISPTGEMKDTLGVLNPLRYRGYVYDLETGFYLTGTRYYDPEIGRFINADSVISGTGESVQGYNLFAYCFNNPVNMSDPTGNWPKWATKLVAAVAVVAVVAAVAAVTVATAGAGTAIAAVAVGAAKGAAIGFAVGAASGAAIGYATTGTLEGTLNGMADGALSGSISGAITGGVNGYSNYSSAANFLKSNGANPKEVLSSYKGTPKVQTLKTDTTVYRTWGGTTQELGHWVSPNNYGSSARNLLSLPAGNTMAHTSSFLLPKGTTVLAGKAAPLFGQSGGGVQWWISVLG